MKETSQSVSLASSIPKIEFLFSYESGNNPDRYLLACCFGEICRYCHSQLIEFYIDNFVAAWKGIWETITEDYCDYALNFIVWKISTTTIHELCHWADVSEKDIEMAEYLVSKYVGMKLF